MTADDMIRNAAYYNTLVDDDEQCTPIYGFRLLVYLDEEGNECNAWKVDGNVPAAHIIGQLDWAKHAMIHQHLEEHEE